MDSKQKIIAMIPARMGSTRLAKKNLALINGKPMISYVVEAAKNSGIFDEIVINSEHTIFAEIAKRHDVDFYQRPEEHATSQAKSDEVVYDFMKNHSDGDVLVWVNSIAPLQQAEEIKEVVLYFQESKLDTLITVKNEQVHCLYDDKPLNYNEGEKFAQTQDLKVVQPFVYSLMMWRYESFKKAYEQNGYAFLSGKVGYFPVGKLSSVIIKTEQDLKLAQYILAGFAANKDFEVQYDEIAKETV